MAVTKNVPELAVLCGGAMRGILEDEEDFSEEHGLQGTDVRWSERKGTASAGPLWEHGCSMERTEGHGFSRAAVETWMFDGANGRARLQPGRSAGSHLLSGDFSRRTVQRQFCPSASLRTPASPTLRPAAARYGPLARRFVARLKPCPSEGCGWPERICGS
jgi:hypothetical protein